MTTPDAPARPLRADARRNRERILAAATEAFAAEGSAVQMDAVAHRAGVGVGTLYRHFPTKEALIAELAGYQVEQCAATTAQLCSRTEAWPALEWFIRRNATDLAGNAGLRQALTSASDFCELSRGQLRAMLAVLVERAHAEGALRAGVTADELLALLGGLATVIDLGGDPERAADVLVAGLRA
jgi:AcrR family transcriptional regulator